MNKRIKQLKINPDDLFKYLGSGEHKTHYNVFAEDVPKGAVLVSAHVSYYGLLVLTIHHPSFEEVEEGKVIPELMPVLRTVN